MPKFISYRRRLMAKSSKHLRKGFEKVLDHAVVEVKARTPVLTGHLQSQQDKENIKESRGTLSSRVGSDVDYAAKQEERVSFLKRGVEVALRNMGKYLRRG